MDFDQELERVAKSYSHIARSGIEAGEKFGIQKGRAEAFAAVIAWIERNRDAHGMAHTESLRALCEQKESGAHPLVSGDLATQRAIHDAK